MPLQPCRKTALKPFVDISMLTNQVLALTGGQKLETEVLESLIGHLATALAAVPAASEAANEAPSAGTDPTRSGASDVALTDSAAAAAGGAVSPAGEEAAEEGEEAEEAADAGPPPLTQRDVAQLRAGLSQVCTWSDLGLPRTSQPAGTIMSAWILDCKSLLWSST